MIIHEMEQGTDEWYAVRQLKLTGSNATAIGNNGAGLKTYQRTCPQCNRNGYIWNYWELFSRKQCHR